MLPIFARPNERNARLDNVEHSRQNLGFHYSFVVQNELRLFVGELGPTAFLTNSNSESPLIYHISNILFWCARIQMIWVHTKTVSDTGVQYPASIRYSPFMQEKR